MGQSEQATEFSPIQTQRQGLFKRANAWLFSQRHFRLKLLSGTAAGVGVILLLAGIFLFVTFRSHRHEVMRAHTIDVIRLSSLIENDLASLESTHRGFLLSGDESYNETFQSKEQLIQSRMDELGSLIANTPAQAKRLTQARDVTKQWTDTVAKPDIESRRAGGASASKSKDATPPTEQKLGTSLLDQARSIVQSIQDEEQIFLNQRMLDEEWGTQSTQILDFLPKLERAVVEMEKEKRGYLISGDNKFVESYKQAVSDFYTYHGYLLVLIANSPSQAELLANIRANVEEWITNSATPEIEARRAGKTGISPNDESQMATIRQMLDTFEKNELSLYASRTAQAARTRVIKTSILGFLAILAVALLVASNSYSFGLVRRQLAELSGVENRIRAIIETILDGMITVNEEGVICSINRAAEKMFGFSEKELHGYKLSKLVPKVYSNDPNVQPTAWSWQAMSKHTGTTVLAVGKTRNLVSFPIDFSLSEMQVDNQKLYVAMVRDVAERKQFEKELAAEKESLAVTLASIGDGVITTDVQGNVIMLNNEAERLTGWTTAEAKAKPLKSVFNVVIDLAAQAKAQTSGFRNEAQSILLTLPENATLRSRDGNEYIIEQVASPIRDNKNEVAGVVLVFRDITERQRNEAERRKAETLEQLGLLAGGIAHDFNNLLTAIIGNISLASLLLPPNDEMTTRLVDAKNASMRARDLAQQLLTFARGGAPIKKTASIGKLIKDTVSFSLRGSHSRSDFLFGLDLWAAEIDPGQISQVIGNLVVNADQAMPNGGTLHIRCDNFSYQGGDEIPDLGPGDYLRIAIRDEGVGIPPENLKRIFDPYFTTKAKGTGLGLATCYSIVKNHNGIITASSELHRGSTFTVYLPAAVAVEHEQPVEPTMPITEAVTGTGNVLIVDDEEAIRALVDFTLTHLGYHVVGAATAEEGVQMYQDKLNAKSRYDVVILDLTLPGGMGGKEALRKLIEIDPTVNAIVSSGYATDATMSRYQDFGFRGVIAKPYEAAELGKVVHDVIESSRVNYSTENYDGGRLATRVA